MFITGSSFIMGLIYGWTSIFGLKLFCMGVWISGAKVGWRLILGRVISGQKEGLSFTSGRLIIGLMVVWISGIFISGIEIGILKVG